MLQTSQPPYPNFHSNIQGMFITPVHEGSGCGEGNEHYILTRIKPGRTSEVEQERRHLKTLQPAKQAWQKKTQDACSLLLNCDKAMTRKMPCRRTEVLHTI